MVTHYEYVRSEEHAEGIDLVVYESGASEPTVLFEDIGSHLRIGPNFVDDLADGELAGLPIAWTSAFLWFDADVLGAPERSLLFEILGMHDPDVAPLPDPQDALVAHLRVLRDGPSMAPDLSVLYLLVRDVIDSVDDDL